VVAERGENAEEIDKQNAEDKRRAARPGTFLCDTRQLATAATPSDPEKSTHGA
jgi:hypothetical protein